MRGHALWFINNTKGICMSIQIQFDNFILSHPVSSKQPYFTILITYNSVADWVQRIVIVIFKSAKYKLFKYSLYDNASLFATRWYVTIKRIYVNFASAFTIRWECQFQSSKLHYKKWTFFSPKLPYRIFHLKHAFPK